MSTYTDLNILAFLFSSSEEALNLFFLSLCNISLANFLAAGEEQVPPTSVGKAGQKLLPTFNWPIALCRAAVAVYHNYKSKMAFPFFIKYWLNKNSFHSDRPRSLPVIGAY